MTTDLAQVVERYANESTRRSIFSRSIASCCTVPRMPKRRLLVWASIAWPLPAVLAGALGWQGVWGSGSALVDYLIPLPVAGGALHVPSFLCCGLAVARLPSLGLVGASRVRAALIGVTLVGVLWLL